MNSTTAQAVQQSAHDRLRARCECLRIPVWRFVAGGAIASRPQQSGPAGAFLRCHYITNLVTQAALEWVNGQDHEPREVFPGCTLLPLPEISRRRVSAVNVTMLLSESALQTEEFAAGCQSACLDQAATRRALTDIAVFTGQSAARVCELLTWTNDDLRRLDDHERTLASFGNQLSESYEEITLLYRLGQSMNELVHPERFVQIACRELHSSLQFAWVAACFAEDRKKAGAVAGRLFLLGETPCDEASFESAMTRLLSQAGNERRIIAGPDRGVLAAGGSQIVCFPVLRDGAPIGVVVVGNKRGTDDQVNNAELKLIEAAAGHMGVLLDNACLYEAQQAMFMGTLEALTAAIDAKDPYTCGHSERVAYLAGAIAAAFGLDKHTTERVRIAGLVHDIGKIGVPESVLRKPGRLTDDEFRLIKLHPQIGYQILKDIPLLDDVLPGVLYHHERYDGRGYPFAVAGPDIPLVARIIGLADAFDAMSSTRTYRPAMNRDAVLGEIRRGAGVQFDADLVEVFLRLDLARYDEMVERRGQCESSRIGDLLPKERAA